MSYVMDTLPMAQGWALIAWQSENNPWAAVERIGPGYIAQEISRRFVQIGEIRVNP